MLQQAILGVVGVPGALEAVIAQSYHSSDRVTPFRNSQVEHIAWLELWVFANNMVYGVLYAMSPELFPTWDRGTGNAIAASANRIFGIMAPIIALYANLNTSVPIWVAGAIFIVAGFIPLLLPFEPRGKVAL